MKKYLLAAVCLLFLSSNAHALDLSRVKNWAASEILTAADLNGEFNNILNHSLTNNDIDAAAGIVGSKLNLSAPGIIGATTAYAGTFTTLHLTGALTADSTSIFKDKMSFTQTDNNEYIDSLADGYLDFEATTGLRWRINTVEQMNLIDGSLLPTTDDDIDLGSTTKEFKDLWIDGTAHIDTIAVDVAGTITGLTDLSANYLSLPETTAPTTAASEGAIYTKDSGTQPELFYREESNGDELQITRNGKLLGITEIFTASDTFTAPAGITKVYLSMVGGGGVGGNDQNYGSSNAGSGGTGGDSVINYPYTVVPGNNYTVTVGGSAQNTSFDSLTVTAGLAGNQGGASPGATKSATLRLNGIAGASGGAGGKGLIHGGDGGAGIGGTGGGGGGTPFGDGGNAATAAAANTGGGGGGSVGTTYYAGGSGICIVMY